jgi:hypothetical protein
MAAAMPRRPKLASAVTSNFGNEVELLVMTGHPIFGFDYWHAEALIKRAKHEHAGGGEERRHVWTRTVAKETDQSSVLTTTSAGDKLSGETRGHRASADQERRVSTRVRQQIECREQGGMVLMRPNLSRKKNVALIQ